MEGEKGSSEIAFCVHYRLLATAYPENVNIIRLFADGVGGQNKNTIIITAGVELVANTSVKTNQENFAVLSNFWSPVHASRQGAWCDTEKWQPSLTLSIILKFSANLGP